MADPVWMSSVCPPFTQARLFAHEQGEIAAEVAAQETKRIIAGGGQPALSKKREFQATTCQGPQCMWFIPTAGPDGKPTGEGMCCEKAKVIVAQQQLVVMGAAAHKFVGPEGMATQATPDKPV